VFTPNLEPTQFVLGDAINAILMGQWKFLVAGTRPNIRELQEVILKS